MNLQEIDAVIFDFGGVLININYQDTIDEFVKLGIEDFESLYSQASQSNLFDDYETGKIGSQRFVNGVLEYLPDGTTPNQVVQAWNAMIKDVPADAIDLLLRIRDNMGKRIFMLSNTNDIHIELAFRRWKSVSNLLPADIFDHVYLSQEINLRKPDPKIFETIKEEQSLVPERTLFIDDSIQHIESAKSLGFKTFCLEKQEQLYDIFS